MTNRSRADPVRLLRVTAAYHAREWHTRELLPVRNILHIQLVSTLLFRAVCVAVVVAPSESDGRASF